MNNIFMNSWRNLVNRGSLIGLVFLVPITSSAALSLKEPIVISESKPLKPGIVSPDLPLPAEDIKPKPALIRGGLSESQIRTMKTMLQEAKKAAIQGKLDEAVGKYEEFAGGPWADVSKELKEKSPIKYNDINGKLKRVDEILSRKRYNIKSKSLRLKFIQEITNLINSVVRAGRIAN